MNPTIENIIDWLLTDSMAITFGVIFVIFISLAILKKLLKIVFVLIFLLVVYFGSFYYLGVDPKDAIEKTKELTKDFDAEKIEKAAQEAGEKIEDVIEKIPD